MATDNRKALAKRLLNCDDTNPLDFNSANDYITSAESRISELESELAIRDAYAAMAKMWVTKDKYVEALARIAELESALLECKEMAGTINAHHNVKAVIDDVLKPKGKL